MESQEDKTIIRSIPYSKINGVGLVRNENISEMEDELILNTKAGIYNLKFKEDNTIVKYMHDIILERIL